MATMSKDKGFRRSLVSLALAACLLLSGVPVLASADEPSESEANATLAPPDSEETIFTLSSVSDEDIEKVVASSEQAASLFARRASGLGELVVEDFSGKDRYETCAMQALSGWRDGSEYAVIATGEGWADALSASGLAGIYDCPILLTPSDGLDESIEEALVQLDVEKVFIVGGPSVVGEQVEADLQGLGIAESNIIRLAGKNRYETQLAVYEQGKGLWSSELVIVAIAAGSEDYADALSAASLAYSGRFPIFLVDGAGNLSIDQEKALIQGAKQGLFQSSLLLGKESCVSAQTEGFMWAVSQLSSGKSKSSVRIAGDNRYETSAALAEWAVENGYLSMDRAAFASGTSPYDALGGGALQGKQNSVLFLVSEGMSDAAISAMTDSGEMPRSIKFFGSEAAVATSVRSEITRALGSAQSPMISYVDCNISLEELLSIEMSQANLLSYTRDEMLSSLNPGNWSFEDSGFYQFAVLADGYTGVASAVQLDAHISKTASLWAEGHYGCTSALRGTGQYFIDAATETGVNEVYLLAHAGIESAWGCSNLAQGTYYDGKGFYAKEWDSVSGEYINVWCDYESEAPAGYYYNFFGIGAFDSDPFRGGVKMAISQGWDSPRQAIIGGADWIARNYILRSSLAQNTLYEMRWDINGAVLNGEVAHQYASSRTWATGIASTMASVYSSLGVDKANSGLRFEIPRFVG